jgi:formamidopyrimidine-DNA glycosylase
MPELPEVETTRRGIDMLITGRRLRTLLVREPRLRWPIPPDLPAAVAGRTVLACTRRGKYVLLHFEHGVQIVHLGMSGSLCHIAEGEAPRKHDHVEWIFDHATLRLHDPRRFGAVLWHPLTAGPIQDHPLLANLGIEPFDPCFNGALLQRHFRNRSAAIKQVLLAGDVVVGVGNIYASESLFQARIHPCRSAQRLSRARCDRLAEAIRMTLACALEAGGSTLRDYVGAAREPGSYFEKYAAVYGRANQPCRVCQKSIRRIVQGGRATYYCPQCQKG